MKAVCVLFWAEDPRRRVVSIVVAAGLFLTCRQGWNWESDRKLIALRKELISAALLGLIHRRYWRGVRLFFLHIVTESGWFCVALC